MGARHHPCPAAVDPDVLLADLRRDLARLNTMANSEVGTGHEARARSWAERTSVMDQVLTTTTALLDAAHYGRIPANWSDAEEPQTRVTEPESPADDHVDIDLLHSVVADLDLGPEWREVPAPHHVLCLITDAGEELRFRDGDAPLPHGTGQPGRIVGEGWLGEERSLLNDRQRPFIRVSIAKTASRAKIRSVFRHRLIARYKLWRGGLVKKLAGDPIVENGSGR